MTATEIKTCELCGKLFTRESHPQRWCAELQRSLEVPNSPICLQCTAHPPKEEEVEVVTHHSYRVVGVKLCL